MAVKDALTKVGVTALASEPVKTLVDVGRKATVAAGIAATGVAFQGIANVTSNGQVSGGELLALVSAVVAAALVAFGATFGATNRKSDNV